MYIYLYKDLLEYNPKLLINNEIIDIKEAETSKNSYFCVSGLTAPSVNKNLMQVVIASMIPYKDDFNLSQKDVEDLKRIFRKLEKENAKRC
jgi:hypothetical protein